MDMKDMTDKDRDLATELGRLGRIHARAARPAPPPEVDEAILARARDAVRARQQPRRWWIPASVAATALIALSLVTRIEQEASPAPPATDLVTAGPQPATVAGDDREQGPVDDPPFRPVPAAKLDGAPAVQADAPTSKRPVPPRQAMPRRASSTPAGDEPLAGATSAEQASGLAAPDAGNSGRITPPITPEAWLEKIETLEAQGRTEEAARQRALLEKAYPGWLSSGEGPH
jgi:hypothetical protein